MSKGSARRPTSPRDRLDCSRGHTMPDRDGYCLRCGLPIASGAVLRDGPVTLKRSTHTVRRPAKKDTA